MFRPPEDKSSCSVSSRLVIAWRIGQPVWVAVWVMIAGRMGSRSSSIKWSSAGVGGGNGLCGKRGSALLVLEILILLFHIRNKFPKLIARLAYISISE